MQQILVSHAANISAQYSPNVVPTYQSAAETLRIPYWDWASDPRVPDIVTNVTITVNGPTGRTTVPNPLYRYRFQQGSVEAGFPGALAKRDETIRCVGDAGLEDNVTASNSNMESAGSHLRTSVVRYPCSSFKSGGSLRPDVLTSNTIVLCLHHVDYF